MATKSSLQQKDFYKSLDLGSIVSMIIAITLVAIIGLLTNYAPNVLQILTNKEDIIAQPEFKRSDFDNRQQLIKSQVVTYDDKISLLSEPIQTPPFVKDPEKLKNYLISRSVPIKTTGTIEKAYLYIKTGKMDIDKESISFYIVDGKTISGHLFAPESIFNGGDNEFIYDLSKLPLVNLPYTNKQSLKPENYHNALSELFNSNIGQGKILYVGAFVSTTNLPNQIEQIEIRYTCVNRVNCKISIGF